jgi:lysophospholipase L1-like esterase
VPAYPEGTAITPASNGDSSSYGSGSEYRCTPPCALDLDLSGAPAALRQVDLVTWFNDDSGFDSNNFFTGPTTYNEPDSYTLDTNAAPGGTGNPPSTGWVARAAVTGNVYNARQHLIQMNGASWIRLRVTSGNPNNASGNTDVSFKLDVTDASQGASDTWLFVGDSITAGAMSYSSPTFAEQVNSRYPSYWPSQIDGGLSGYKTADLIGTDSKTGQSYISEILAAFPYAHYVTLNLGTNDVDQGVSASTVVSNLETLAHDVLAVGKVPIIPTIPWAPASCSSALANNNPATAGTANYGILKRLYPAIPQVIHGPDLWAFFNQNQSYINSSNCPHPTGTGYAAYRQEWVAYLKTLGIW